MPHPYAENLIETVEIMAEMDLYNLLNLRFRKAMREVLAGSKTPDVALNADEIVAGLTVELPPDSLTDDQLSRLVTAYAKVINNLWQAFSTIGFGPDDTLKMLSTGLSVTLR